MTGAEENHGKSILPMCMSWVSKELLHELSNQRNLSNENQRNGEGDEEEDGELELSLGLSLNGKFGVDPARKKLRRCSSGSNSGFTNGAVENVNGQQARGVVEGHAPLLRTCSMPAGAEEEWRRRKVVESMRQMEARKERIDKSKNVRMVNDVENFCEDFGYGSGFFDVVNAKRGCGITIGSENVNVLPSSQDSIASWRCGSSGFSDRQSQQIEGQKQNTEVKSPLGILSPPLHAEQAPVDRAADRNDAEETNELLKTALLDMPYVTTNRPNGNKMSGFLYKYKRGEDVKIVCVCHGIFLSPAEFIKHAGGGDVEHPLRHIVVTQSPLF